MNFILFFYIFISLLCCPLAHKIHKGNNTQNVTIVRAPLQNDVNISQQINPTRLDVWYPLQKLSQVKHFYLFTKYYRNGTEYELVDPTNITSIKLSHFQPAETYIIIHGFLANGLEKWILELKDKLLGRYDCNVISVEWPSGTEWYLPSYREAAKRVKAVGNDTADLLRVLRDRKGLLLSELHIIGHSLGAHVAGFTGKAIDGRVARITGLDPAGPEFRNVDKLQRLDKTDAAFVDVMHTNACSSWLFVDCYGITEDIGHVNFWPNGGVYQPFCGSVILEKLKGEFGCNHELSYTYYIESLDYDTTENYFLSRSCNTWDEYLNNNCSCGDAPQFMGINANPDTLGRFFLKTNSSPPFALKDTTCQFNDLFNWPFAAFLITVGIIAVAIAMCVFFSYRNSRHIYIHSASSSIIDYVTERSPLIK